MAKASVDTHAITTIAAVRLAMAIRYDIRFPFFCNPGVRLIVPRHALSQV